jgi:hypothetical protein
VRKHLARLSLASAQLAIVLSVVLLPVAACGSSSPTATGSPTPSCVNASATHHAYVVVQHLGGTSLQRCIGFTGDTVNGKDLMSESGIKYQTQTFSFGIGVCAVDNEPATFTECFPKNQPYWSLFVEDKGAWTQAQVGFDQENLKDKDALGWRYVPAADQNPSPPPLAKES